MCGIAGVYIGNTNKYSMHDIREITNLMVNFQDSRGPDAKGLVSLGKNIYFGHNRLSIVDLNERSNQPMYFKNWMIVYNGEIYNFNDIKQSLITNHGAEFDTTGDTEVIIQGIYYLGFEKLLQELNGIFAIVAYNSVDGRIWAVRDRLGVKPLFYYHDGSAFVFASTPGAIAQSLNKKLGITFDLDHRALEEFFSLGCVYGPRSLFKGIKRLMPAELMTVDDDLEINNKKYWKVKKTKTPIEELEFLIRDSIEKRMLSDVKMQILLSGGIDSSVLASIMDADCLHVTDASGVEGFYADKAAKRFKRNLTVVELPRGRHAEVIIDKQIVRYIQTSGDISRSSILPTLSCMMINREGYKVGVSGNGGDELFFGYKRIPTKIGKVRGNHFSHSAQGLLREQIYRIFRKPSTFQIGDLRRKTEKEFITDLVNKFKFDDDELNEVALTRWIEFCTMISDLNTTLDFAGMAHSVEMRVPFLDYRLVEASLNLEFKEVRKKGPLKKILLDSGLPRTFVDRRKHGFSSKVLRQYTEYHGLLALDKIQSEYNNLITLTSSLVTNRDYGYILASARMLELWIKHWVETGIVRI